MPRPRLIASLLSLMCAVGVGVASASGPAKSGEAKEVREADAEFFETRIRPVLVGGCEKCHGPAKALGGLRLDSHAALLKGGGRGAGFISGKPDVSLLVRAIRQNDPEVPRMPPAGKLTAQQIADLEEWVRRGAPWPEYAPDQSPAALWSVQPVRRPAVPKVVPPAGRPEWVRNPIDAFVLRGLQSHRMVPAPEAGRLELMRRLYFDVIGLPPTPEEVARFLKECEDGPRVETSLPRNSKLETRNSGLGTFTTRGVAERRVPPGQRNFDIAYKRLVDRLLASPQYGERWARYWLDLVRYADTNGYERDAEKTHSWKYRDYVIRSLNADKPYDRFVMEQLAGDELPDRTEETVTATGFLRLGTWDDEPNDPLEYRYERLDDLVHASSTAFLGLTLKCARCHDHKFDPLPQRDYYAFAAAFYGGFLDAGDRKLLGGPPEDRLGYPVLGFTDRGPEAPPLRLLKNGDPKREEEVVPPGYLTLLPALNRPVQPPPPGARTTHRRLQLARWMVDPRNPLTPRVIVNRVWQHHFGEGLVRTPNNFGRKGALPTHPELLDYLAAVFSATPERMGEGKKERMGGTGTVTGAVTRGVGSSFGSTPRPLAPSPAEGLGWSLKKLHRLILLSSTYRMASIHPREAEYAQLDAANERLWRANRRRLDADAMRDAMLAVSGLLNPTAGGPGFTPSVASEALEGLSRKGAEWVPSPPEEQRRRSIYMFLKRALIPPLMAVFDFGDTTQPLEQRDVTTVAPQALALLNNSFVHAQSAAFAERVARLAGNDPARQVEQAWRLAYGRPPTPAERTESMAYLRSLATVPARPAASPKPVTDGLRLWLRADRGVRTDPQGRVTAWEDQSGATFSATQAAEAARPRLVSGVLGGRPALRFDGKGNFLEIPGQVLRSQQFTVVAVATDRTQGQGHREIFSNWRRDTNVGTSVFLGTTGGGAVRMTDHFAPAGVVDDPARPFILSGVAASDYAAIYQNRSRIARKSGTLPSRNLAGPYVIGQQGNIGGEYWDGEIAELQVFDRALSEEELATVWEDVGRRYGIAAPPSPQRQALISLCHTLFNTNEFLYVD